MHSPKPVAADPAIAAAQAAEQVRAENGQISQTQKTLSADTVALRRRFGTLASSLGGQSSGSTGGNGSTGTASPAASSYASAAGSAASASESGGLFATAMGKSLRGLNFDKFNQVVA